SELQGCCCCRALSTPRHEVIEVDIVMLIGGRRGTLACSTAVRDCIGIGGKSGTRRCC
ncbi:hypothetical protein QBC32DRAFT_179383, partial [Pseudoneurospora amorphoporcata]